MTTDNERVLPTATEIARATGLKYESALSRLADCRNGLLPPELLLASSEELRKYAKESGRLAGNIGNAEWQALGDVPRNENLKFVGPHIRPEAKVKQNNIMELTDVLFEQIDRLNGDELTAEQLQTEIVRSQAITNVAAQILNCGHLMLKAGTAATNGGLKKMPKLLG